MQNLFVENPFLWASFPETFYSGFPCRCLQVWVYMMHEHCVGVRRWSHDLCYLYLGVLASDGAMVI